MDKIFIRDRLSTRLVRGYCTRNVFKNRSLYLKE